MRNVTEFSKRDANYLLTSILDRCDAMRSEGGSPDIVLSGIEDLIRQSKDSVDLPKAEHF